MRKYRSLAERIRANVEVSTLDFFEPNYRHPAAGTPCWLWLGARNSQGYGKITLRWKRGPRKGKVRSALAHRMALIAFNPDRRLTTKSVTMHLCNHKLCCNPAHLVGGSQKKNIQQCVREGRHKTPFRKTS